MSFIFLVLISSTSDSRITKRQGAKTVMESDLSPLDHTVLFLFVCRKTGQALHATASQPRPHQHHQHRVVHDEEDGVRREDDDGEGLDVVGLDVGSQQEEQRRPPHTGTGIGILSTMLKGATLCGGNLCPPSHPLFTAWT